jgi:hypothetical protein
MGMRIGGRNPNLKAKTTMNITHLHTLRTALLAALLSISALLSVHAAAPAPNALALAGAITVKAAGPYVEVGSYRIWVSAHLGKPNIALADGTWLYNNFEADDSGTTGTLLVRFHQGQVSELKLVSPTYVAALCARSQTLFAMSHR